MKFLPFSQTKLGSLLLLCAQGRAGQAQHLFSLRRISQSEIRNSAAAEKRGRAKIPSPQPPSFLPARAIGFQISKSGFSSKKVRILTKRHRQFSELGFWAIVASPRQRRGSASVRILKGFLKSQNNFCPLKRKFGSLKANINLKNLLTNLFSFAFGEKQSDNFKYFDCLTKTI